MIKCYAAKCKCGQVIAAAIYPDPSQKEWVKDVEKSLLQWANDGLIIETVDAEAAKVQLSVCQCDTKNLTQEQKDIIDEFEGSGFGFLYFEEIVVSFEFGWWGK